MDRGSGAPAENLRQGRNRVVCIDFAYVSKTLFIPERFRY
jgi:hypothetical protein